MKKGTNKSRSRRKNGDMDVEMKEKNESEVRSRRKSETSDTEAFSSKNLRLAKELSELRIRYRDETKTVTRLTMENMTLSTRCREALKTVTALRQELDEYKRRLADFETDDNHKPNRIMDTRRRTKTPPPPPPPVVDNSPQSMPQASNDGESSINTVKSTGPISSDFFLNQEEGVAFSSVMQDFEKENTTIPSSPLFRLSKQPTSSIEAFEASFEASFDTTFPSFDKSSSSINLAFDEPQFTDPFFIGSLDLNTSKSPIHDSSHEPISFHTNNLHIDAFGDYHSEPKYNDFEKENSNVDIEQEIKRLDAIAIASTNKQRLTKKNAKSALYKDADFITEQEGVI